MKRILISAMLIGITGFASAAENISVVSNYNTNNVVTNVNRKITYEDFIQKVKSGEIVIKSVNTGGVDFIFNDSCGGSWHVTGGEGMSMPEIVHALLKLDEQVCG